MVDSYFDAPLPPQMDMATFFFTFVRNNPPDQIIGEPSRPYLQRWHLNGRNRQGTVYLHRFLRSDDDRALHDHPGDSVSFILAGKYIEHTSEGSFLRRAGETIFRTAEQAHRIELFKELGDSFQPVLTLFIMGPRRRDWGFHCPQGWRRWQDFCDPINPDAPGPGCG